MIKTRTHSQSKSDEFARIFDEYHAKIEAITRNTDGGNRQPFDGELNDAIDNADKNAEEIITQGQQESPKIHEELAPPDNKEAARIINDARLKARQLLNEAEERIKKEARKKTKSEVDRIITRTRKESEDIIARTRQVAEKERGEVIARSKQEVEQLIRDITENCRREAQGQSAQIVNEAQEKAEKMIGDVVACSKDIIKLVSEITNKTKAIIGDFENTFHVEYSELDRVIVEAREKFEHFKTESMERGATKAAPSNISEKWHKNTVLSVQIQGDKSDGGNGSNSLFSGQVEFKTVSSFDYLQIKKFRDYLTKFPSIKYVSESVSEKEMSVLFNMKEPLPLLDILNDIPLVDEVVTKADGVNLILKNHI